MKFRNSADALVLIIGGVHVNASPFIYKYMDIFLYGFSCSDICNLLGIVEWVTLDVLSIPAPL